MVQPPRPVADRVFCFYEIPKMKGKAKADLKMLGVQRTLEAYCGLEARDQARDQLQSACATAAFRFHLNIHLNKGDTHIYRIFKERVFSPEHGKALGIMSRTVPEQRFPKLIAGCFR